MKSFAIVTAASCGSKRLEIIYHRIVMAQDKANLPSVHCRSQCEFITSPPPNSPTVLSLQVYDIMFAMCYIQFPLKSHNRTCFTSHSLGTFSRSRALFWIKFWVLSALHENVRIRHMLNMGDMLQIITTHSSHFLLEDGEI